MLSTNLSGIRSARKVSIRKKEIENDQIIIFSLPAAILSDFGVDMHPRHLKVRRRQRKVTKSRQGTKSVIGR